MSVGCEFWHQNARIFYSNGETFKTIMLKISKQFPLDVDFNRENSMYLYFATMFVMEWHMLPIFCTIKAIYYQLAEVSARRKWPPWPYVLYRTNSNKRLITVHQSQHKNSTIATNFPVYWLSCRQKPTGIFSIDLIQRLYVGWLLVKVITFTD